MLLSPTAPPALAAPIAMSARTFGIAPLARSASEPMPTESSKSAPALWELLVEKLPPIDDATEWYDLHMIQELTGVKEPALRHHCRDLWPGRDRGRWRFNRDEAIRLIRRISWAGCKGLPRLEDLIGQRGR